ncbi:hypothetical protein FE257_003251 [Aspergillus nanangensis]|uniref:Uncharacterized protein n=1 Tax=Aspergillus nanangensis TaxID=2582783 RepID=A0AAD4CS90_ASPNN|nr:hypothetical protein FE257_003251 [Aspergillus nanangensis]
MGYTSEDQHTLAHHLHGKMNAQQVSQSTGDCNNQYFSILSRQLQSAFPEFVANLQDQSPAQREQGRSAVLEYTAGKCSKRHVFENSTDLGSYLMRDEFQQSGPPKGRLFLLEDLPRNHIEAIGSQLCLPPSFFAAQWYDPATPTFNYRSPFTRCSSNQFIVRYPSSHRITFYEQLSEQYNVYAWHSNISRHLYMYDPKGPLVDDPKSYHALSFWTTGARKDGSWDAVLLLDPPVGDTIISTQTSAFIKIKSHPSDRASPQMGSLYPEVHDIYPNPIIPGFVVPPNPSYISLFDDVLALSEVATRGQNNDPRESACIARQLVISIFLAFLRRRYLNLMGLQSRIPCPQSINRCNYLRSFMKGSLSAWQHELFGFIVNVKFGINVLLKEVEDNMAALGLGPDVAGGTATAPSWERDGWTAVHEGCTTILDMTNMLLDSYLQFVSIEEARLSNQGAKSLARITILTSLFIPLSTIAAILSMNETFLPGNRDGWIFWVICLPVLLVIAIVYSKKSLHWIAGLIRQFIGQLRDVMNSSGYLFKQHLCHNTSLMLNMHRLVQLSVRAWQHQHQQLQDWQVKSRGIIARPHEWAHGTGGLALVIHH